MAARLREADSIAAVAELQQHIAELEIQVTSDDIKHVASYSLLFVLFFLSFCLLSFFNLLWVQDSTCQNRITLSCIVVPPL